MCAGLWINGEIEMKNNHPAIVVRDLRKDFGDFTAVGGISLEVARGEIFGFLGPNGSGKTTTIRMMLGLLQPSAGSVEVLGMQVDGNTESIRPKAGYMAQRFSLYSDLTVLQNLQFHGKVYGLTNKLLNERIQEALAMADLEGREKMKTKDLSGGWRQRLALSAAILHQPEVVFLDEPTAGVDPLSRRAFWDLLYTLVARDITVFVTTHYMDEADHCHQLAFIQRGKLIAKGSPEEIKTEKMSGQVLEIAPSDAVQSTKVLRRAAQTGRIPLEEVELYGALVHVVAPQIGAHIETIRDLLQKEGIDPGQMDIIEPSLEDVFIASMQ